MQSRTEANEGNEVASPRGHLPSSLPSVDPLGDFYAARGLTLPAMTEVAPDEIPDPYRGLLVHESDMTSRLEAFHQQKIHIRLVARHTRSSDYCREVVLELDDSLRPVEFGAIKILLENFPAEARAEILREQRPLGRILHDCRIVFSSRPRAFFRVATDSFIGGELRVADGTPLFGRRNSLVDAWERPLAIIVEILPP